MSGIRDGTLPNLGRLLGRGASARIRGIDGFFIGSTWPSIYTGMTPAQHGFHYLEQLVPGSYEFCAPAGMALPDGTTFWSALSRAGRRVAILDAPLSAMDDSINGMQIVEWGVHDAVHGFHAQPATLEETLHAQFGSHPVGSACDGKRRTEEDYGEFVDALVRGVEKKCEMTCAYLGEGGWDLFMQVFSEAHCAGHQAWHLHDMSHPAHVPAIAAAIGDPIWRVYRAIDAAIGKICALAGDCTICVFSSHGMSHWYGAHFLLDEILIRLRVMQRPPPVSGTPGPAEIGLAGATWLWHKLPQSVRRSLAGLRERLGEREASSARSPAVDFELSRCFHQPNGLAVGGIRLNLAGREPQGILAPGDEADRFCRALQEDLTEVVDERTGRPLITHIIRVSEHFQGRHLDGLPDLLLVYDDQVATGSRRLGNGDGATVRLTSPKIGLIEGANSYGRSGEHRAAGLLIAAGPNVNRGTVPGEVRIYDLAPTWTGMLGVELDGIEGRAIEGLSTRVADGIGR